MPIFVPQVCVELDMGEEVAILKAIKLLKLKQSDIKSASIAKKSVDARRKQNIKLVYTVCIELKSLEQEKIIAENNSGVKFKCFEKLKVVYGDKKLEGRPVVIGFGPAGILASYMLAKHGYRPIVIERGEDVDSRVKRVEQFWNECILNENSNVQFGEGGAGTFSDGKLVTRINDPLCEFVTSLFIKHGAPYDIKIKAKPHIGTDMLREIIKSIRNEIVSLGAEIRFMEKLDLVNFRGNRIYSVLTNKDEIRTNAVVLAIGHSARDTFEMLLRNNIAIESKAFSVGVRIEHLQKNVDRALYGKFAGHPSLPRGEYAYSYKVNGRCVYTFCMCPGGVVVPAASEEGGVVTNGMSKYARDGENANAALVVSVSRDDFGSSPLSGMYFQRNIEKLAFEMGSKSYVAPMTNVGTYLNGLPYREGKVIPTYRCGTKISNIENIFPYFVNDMLKIGIRKFDTKLNGFASRDSIITAPETRTSSPIRILRNSNFMSISCDGLFPCGEGAGYAGGIMSAAVDGIKVAMAVMHKFNNK